jgi:hypothetical protein
VVAILPLIRYIRGALSPPRDITVKPRSGTPSLGKAARKTVVTVPVPLPGKLDLATINTMANHWEDQAFGPITDVHQGEDLSNWKGNTILEINVGGGAPQSPVVILEGEVETPSGKTFVCMGWIFVKNVSIFVSVFR